MPSILAPSTAKYIAMQVMTIEGCVGLITKAIRETADQGLMECEVKIPNTGTASVGIVAEMFVNAGYQLKVIDSKEVAVTIKLGW